MREVADYLIQQFEEHWIKFLTAAAFMALGWLFGKRRAPKQWAKREFLDRLNISLTTIADGTLQIRTLVEKSCRDVFLNAVAADAINVASKQTAPDDPILPLPKDDYWYYLNAVLNEISEKFAVGQMRKDLGQKVDSAKYLICLTSERAGTVRTQKVRALITQRRLLENLPEDVPRFESPSHSTRWDTLQFLAKKYRQEPHKFLEVEICL